MDDTHTLNLRPPVWLPIIVVILAGGAYMAGKLIETRDREKPMITVTGEGKAFAVPDIAELRFGVQTGRQPSHKQAMERLANAMTKMLETVKAQGIEEKDIRTEFLSLQPVYDYTERGQIFRGFEASQTLAVKVRDLDTVGAVLSAATSAGSNQIGSVNFTIDEPEAVRAEARAKAIVQAKEKAAKLAADLGMTLGEIENFSEGGGYFPPVMMRDAVGIGGAELMEKALPVPAGEQEVNVQVALTYELQ